MWPARYFEDALKRQYYYKVLCTWVMRNSSQECFARVKMMHPDYNGSLLDYYHKDAVSFYSEQLKYAPTNKVTVDDVGIVIHGWGRYTYSPLEDIGCLGMLYALIDADPSVYDHNKEVGLMIMKQLHDISPLKAKELKKIINRESFRMTPMIMRKKASASGISIENQFGPVYKGCITVPYEDPLDAIRRYAAFREVDGKIAIDMNSVVLTAPKDKKGDKADAPKKKTTKKETKDSKPKLITSTFEYKYANQKDGQDRVLLLFRVLSSEKSQRIDIGASPDDWEALFSGEPSSFQIKWTGTIQHLYHIFFEAKKRGLIKPKGARIWQIVSSHFIKEDDQVITTDELNSQHLAKEEKDALNMLVDILDVSIPVNKNVKIQ